MLDAAVEADDSLKPVRRRVVADPAHVVDDVVPHGLGHRSSEDSFAVGHQCRVQRRVGHGWTARRP